MLLLDADLNKILLSKDKPRACQKPISCNPNNSGMSQFHNNNSGNAKITASNIIKPITAADFPKIVSMIVLFLVCEAKIENLLQNNKSFFLFLYIFLFFTPCRIKRNCYAKQLVGVKGERKKLSPFPHQQTAVAEVSSMVCF